jgi:hypothetical protein
MPIGELADGVERHREGVGVETDDREMRAVLGGGGENCHGEPPFVLPRVCSLQGWASGRAFGRAEGPAFIGIVPVRLICRLVSCPRVDEAVEAVSREAVSPTAEEDLARPDREVLPVADLWIG